MKKNGVVEWCGWGVGGVRGGLGIGTYTVGDEEDHEDQWCGTLGVGVHFGVPWGFFVGFVFRRPLRGPVPRRPRRVCARIIGALAECARGGAHEGRLQGAHAALTRTQ